MTQRIQIPGQGRDLQDSKGCHLEVDAPHKGEVEDTERDTGGETVTEEGETTTAEEGETTTVEEGEIITVEEEEITSRHTEVIIPVVEEEDLGEGQALCLMGTTTS